MVGLDLNLERCSRNVPAVLAAELLDASRLVAIVKKRLTLPLTLYETLQILSLTLFEQTPLDQLLAHAVNDLDPSDPHNQMNLFE